MLTDRQLSEDLNRLSANVLRNSVALLQRLNRLTVAGEPWRVDAMVIDTQRLYLEAARRYVASLDTPPPWMPRMLRDWDDTLTAWERLDHSWLAERLDAFAKFELFSAVMREAGHDWQSLPQRRDLFCELALLNQSYHEFCNPASVFAQLESAGLLQHRVGPQILPGTEPEPFVPETGTRRELGRGLSVNTRAEPTCWSTGTQSVTVPTIHAALSRTPGPLKWVTGPPVPHR